jgi:inward rectifier potassium channel
MVLSQRAVEEENRDLGFGSVVARESGRRLLNRDGSFNVERHGMGARSSLSLYYSLLTMGWPAFIMLALAAYLLTNGLFALVYFLCGPGSLAGGIEAAGTGQRLVQAFFFSVHTVSTVGYGHIVPVSLAANVVMTLEAVVGLFGLALGTGLVFARFSRPIARIVFSRCAVIAPYRGITAFEFRIANQRRNEIVDVRARIAFSRLEEENGERKRRFYQLQLERHKVSFFPLAWTIVHPIDEESPLWGVSEDEFCQSDPEFLVLLTGMDETFSQMVHARSSYKAAEVVWDARFQSIFERTSPNAPLAIDVSRIHDIHPAPDGAEAVAS